MEVAKAQNWAVEPQEKKTNMIKKKKKKKPSHQNTSNI
jgi:hypothetical protein